MAPSPSDDTARNLRTVVQTWSWATRSNDPDMGMCRLFR